MPALLVLDLGLLSGLEVPLRDHLDTACAAPHRQQLQPKLSFCFGFFWDCNGHWEPKSKMVFLHSFEEKRELGTGLSPTSDHPPPLHPAHPAPSFHRSSIQRSNSNRIHAGNPMGWQESPPNEFGTLPDCVRHPGTVAMTIFSVWFHVYWTQVSWAGALKRLPTRNTSLRVQHGTATFPQVLVG